MPRIIVKCKYYSSAKNIRDIGGMLKYIATREGVDKLGDGWQAEPVSKAQEDLIMKFCETHGCKSTEAMLLPKQKDQHRNSYPLCLKTIRTCYPTKPISTISQHVLAWNA